MFYYFWWSTWLKIVPPYRTTHLPPHLLNIGHEALVDFEIHILTLEREFPHPLPRQERSHCGGHICLSLVSQYGGIYVCYHQSSFVILLVVACQCKHPYKMCSIQIKCILRVIHWSYFKCSNRHCAGLSLYAFSTYDENNVDYIHILFL